ncbi:hypothetical protein JCM10207_002928 [Rhodosporidiobolus poonsookiae]
MPDASPALSIATGGRRSSPLGLPTPAAPTAARAQFSQNPAWALLFARYQDGTAGLNPDEVPVPKPDDLVYEGNGTAEDDAAAAAATAHWGTADYVRHAYRQKGFMPALHGPREVERQRTVLRYSLNRIQRVPAIEALAKLARDIFDIPVIVNVVLEDKVVFVASSGWDEAHESDAAAPRLSTKLDSSFCPHAMAKDEQDGCFILNNPAADWRFARSPMVQEGEGRVQFFASANINLPAAAPPGVPAHRLPVGSLCLLDSKSRPPLTEREQRILKQLAGSAAKEFELAFQQERNDLMELRNVWISEIFRSLLVFPSRSLSASIEERCHSDSIAVNLKRHTNSDFSFVLDLRSFNSPTFPSSPPASPTSDRRFSQNGAPDFVRRSSSTSHQRASPPGAPETARGATDRSRQSFGGMRRDPGLHGPGTIAVMDAWCEDDADVPGLEDRKKEWRERVTGPIGVAAVTQALRDYHADQRRSFSAPLDAITPLSPLDTALSSIVPPDTTSMIAAPIFDHEGEPALYVVVGSRQRYFAYEQPADERFITGIGAMVLGSMLQEKILAADQAKLAFVGQVSHELRTPMFAIAGNLELIRAMSEPSTLDTISPLIDVAETCLATLRDVLDDTLEFAKLSNHSELAPEKRTPAPKRSLANLEQLCIDVIRSCWHKARQYAARRDGEAGEEVDILLESHLPPGLQADIDVAGLKRVMLNLVGNSLKFTSTGSITIRLQDVSEPSSSSSHRNIRFDVVDTGRGMSQEFVREHLFTPFRQEDSFEQGSGLGVNLAASLVGRMNGRISFTSEVGAGTTASCILPLNVVRPSSPSGNFPLPTVRNLSDELSRLIRSPSQPCSRASSPSRHKRRNSTLSPLSSTSNSTASSATSTSQAVPPSSDKLEDFKRTEKLSKGALTALDQAEAVADGRKSAKNVPPEIDGPLERESAVKVLVVDDNDIARRILCTFLKTKHIPFVEASGGKQAIELFKFTRPNIVWCDIQMPDIDGIEATRQMRQYETEAGLRPARIIALSGLDSTLGEHGDMLTSGQVDRWIVKGGPSLRALSADLLDYAAKLSPPSSAASSPSPSPSDSPPPPHPHAAAQPPEKQLADLRLGV